MSGLSLQGKSNCGKHHHYNATCLRCAEELLAAARKREERYVRALEKQIHFLMALEADQRIPKEVLRMSKDNIKEALGEEKS